MAKTTTIQKTLFRLLMLILTWAIGLAIYNILPCFGTGKILFLNVTSVSNIVSTFCVALIGFLSGIIVLISGLKDNYFFRYYKNNGGLNSFLFFYYFTIISLVITHLTTIAAISDYYWMKIMISSIIMNVLQIIFIIAATHSVYAKGDK